MSFLSQLRSWYRLILKPAKQQQPVGGNYRGLDNGYKDDIPTRDAIIRAGQQRIRSGQSNWLAESAHPEAHTHGERIPEYLLMTEVLGNISSASILDVGCVLNNQLLKPFLRGHSLSLLNPALEGTVIPIEKYYQTKLDDFESDTQYDLVTCLSTLEHIGFDNSRYGVQEFDLGWDAEACVDVIVSSLRKLSPLIKQNGTLIVSLPYGRPEYVRLPPRTGKRAWQVCSQAHVEALSSDSTLQGLNYCILKLHKGDGWQISAPDDSFEEFGAIGPGASGLLLISNRTLYPPLDMN